MKIGLDITFLFDQYSYRGIGNYGREVIKELVKNKDHDWVLFGYGNVNSNLLEIKSKLSSNLKFISLGNKRKSSIFNIPFFYFKFLPKIKSQHLDMFYSFNFEQGLPLGVTRVGVTVHDVIPYITKSYSQKNRVVNFLKGIFYKYNLKRAKKADIIFTSSQFTKNELVLKAGFNPAKIVTTYPGIKETFRLENIDTQDRDIRRVLITYNITQPYIVYYGGIESNKNVPQVIRAFHEITNRFPDLKLVIVGKEFKLGWDNKVKPLNAAAVNLIKLCDDLKIKHRVVFTGEAQENHMPIILSHAKLMLNLSLYEGFGLAVLESLAAGVPLIASKKSCYPEVLGDAAILTDPADIKSIASHIENLLTDKALYNHMKDCGIKRAKEFNWQITSQDILKAIKNDVIGKLNKKVIYVIPFFYPFSGGAENNCKALAIGAKELGSDVKIFTSYRKDFTCRKFENYQGIQIHRFLRLNNSYYLGFYPGLFFKLLFTKADIIHVHGFGFIWQDFCIFIKKIFSPKTKFLNTPHGPFMTLSNYSAGAKILKSFYNPLLKFIIKFTYNVVFQVNPNQEKWITLYGVNKEKIIYLPNGIDDGAFSQYDSAKKTAKHFDLNRKFIISFIGRFEEYKGIQDIIKAISLLKKSIKTLRFIAVGLNGSYFNQIIQLVKTEELEDNVKLLLNPSDEIKKNILSLSKIYILPSKWEAFGISILEAMAQGNAIISTDTEGGKFLIKDGENGYLVKYGDFNQIAELINQMYKDNELLNLISQNNLVKAKQFNWKEIIKIYAKAIQN